MGWRPLWESIAGRVRTWAGIKITKLDEDEELEKRKDWSSYKEEGRKDWRREGYGGLVVEYGWVLEEGRDQELFMRHVFRGLLSLLFNGVEALTCKNSTTTIYIYITLLLPSIYICICEHTFICHYLL